LPSSPAATIPQSAGIDAAAERPSLSSVLHGERKEKGFLPKDPRFPSIY